MVELIEEGYTCIEPKVSSGKKSPSGAWVLSFTGALIEPAFKHIEVEADDPLLIK